MIRKKITNREELLFLMVLALPNASSNGFDSKIISFVRLTSGLCPFCFSLEISLNSIVSKSEKYVPLTAAMNCRMCFDVTVFPAPLSPLS
jgi:hypothetical protein